MDGIATRALEALKGWGAHPCLIELGPKGDKRPLSASQLRFNIVDSASQLADWGAKRGVCVGLFLENSTDFISTLLALSHNGSVAVLGKLEYRHLELQEYFANADPPLIIAEASFLPLLAPYLAGRGVISRSESGLKLEQAGSNHPRVAGLPDDVASVNYTYRGYGYPLGALVTHQQYLHGARVLQEDGLEALRAEQMLYSIPMSHIFTLIGCILTPLLYGLTGVIARTIHPRVLFAAIAELKVQHLTAVPELYALLQGTKGDSLQLPSLRTFVSGGSCLPDQLYRQLCSAFDVEVLHGYGLTEFTPVSRNSRGRGREGTVGRVCDGIECRIDNEEGPQNGEILIRSGAISPAYLGRSRETEEAWCRGWFRTGDRGRFDGDHLVFESTIKKTGKTNGVMVDLEEIRRALLLDTDIAEATVVLDQDGLSASVVPSRNVQKDEKLTQLRNLLREQLAAYKTPRTINIL